MGVPFHPLEGTELKLRREALEAERKSRYEIDLSDFPAATVGGEDSGAGLLPSSLQPGDGELKNTQVFQVCCALCFSESRRDTHTHIYTCIYYIYTHTHTCGCGYGIPTSGNIIGDTLHIGGCSYTPIYKLRKQCICTRSRTISVKNDTGNTVVSEQFVLV